MKRRVKTSKRRKRASAKTPDHILAQHDPYDLNSHDGLGSLTSQEQRVLDFFALIVNGQEDET